MDSKPLADAPGDPSMEDILASIRRILNDGETEAGEPATAEVTFAAPAPPVLAFEPAPPPPPVEDVFELDSSMLIEEPVHVPSDRHMADIEPPVAAPGPLPSHDEGLMAPAAAAAASASLGALVRVVSQKQTPVYRGGPSLEDIVRDEIRPLVKEWLDENLAPMVERMVRAEIERVTRG